MRGLTNFAFREYLESDALLAPLAACLVDETVLCDTLINAMSAASMRPACAGGGGGRAGGA